MAFVAAGVALIVGFIVFAMKSVIENASWDAVGKSFDTAGRGDLSFMWGVLGILLTVTFVVGIALALLSRVGNSGGRLRF